MNRREFLKVCGTVLMCQSSPFLLKSVLAKQKAVQRLLVLVELKGGNDGLNMLVPFTEPKYFQLRPKLAVKRDRVLQVSETLGFNPQLTPLMDIWKQKQLAIISGVGYPQPNRSHFRSIDIWDTGSSSKEYLREGWLARLLPHIPKSATATADGATVGSGAGPLAGGDFNVIVMRKVERFFRQAQKVQAIEVDTENPALSHILSVQNHLNRTATLLKQRIATAGRLSTPFPKTVIGRNLETAAKLIACHADIPVIKVSQGGFDTHANQQSIHDRLLGQLAEALAAFRNAMLETGMWLQVVVMTYSEFGRRPAENGSRGTDHGTAAPHLMLGGNIKGGLYGVQPSLVDLENGDLKFNVDFRSLYTTIARRWFGVSAEFLNGRIYALIDCIA